MRSEIILLQKVWTLFSVKGTAWKVTSCVIFRAEQSFLSMELAGRLDGTWYLSQQILSAGYLTQTTKQTKTQITKPEKKLYKIISLTLLFKKKKGIVNFEEVGLEV